MRFGCVESVRKLYCIEFDELNSIASSWEGAGQQLGGTAVGLPNATHDGLVDAADQAAFCGRGIPPVRCLGCAQVEVAAVPVAVLLRYLPTSPASLACRQEPDVYRFRVSRARSDSENMS